MTRFYVTHFLEHSLIESNYRKKSAHNRIRSYQIVSLELKTNSIKLAPRDKSIYLFISLNPGCKSGDISTKLNIPNPTIKRILSQLVKDELIEKFGKGAGTNYAVK